MGYDLSSQKKHTQNCFEVSTIYAQLQSYEGNEATEVS